MTARSGAAPLFAALLLTTVTPLTQAAATHPFSAHDMVTMERLGAPVPSPDGRWVVFTRRSWDEASNTTTTHLWLAAIDGSAVRALTSASHVSDSSPCWSPDGRWVAFLSSRGESSQIWAIAIDGGEPVQVSSFPVDVDNLEWSPDGTRFAFSAEVFPDCADLACTARRDSTKAASPVKAMTFDHLMVRHWDAWFTGKRNHLFTVAVRLDSAPELLGAPVDLLGHLDHDAPTRPSGGTEEFAFSPDGRQLAFTSNMAAQRAWSTDNNIYLVPSAGGAVTCVSAANHATDTQPTWSPDGTTLAWLAMTRPGFEADRQRIVLYTVQSRKLRALTDAWDRSVGSLVYAPDGRSLLVTAEDSARTRIFRVDVADGAVTTLVAAHTNDGLAPVAAATGSGAGRIVFAQNSLTAPAEIFTARLDGSDLRQLTHVNDAHLAATRIAQAEEFWFPGAGGDHVHGWLMKPVDYTPGRIYPLAYLIHGGPQGSWSDDFHYRWNMQAYAGAGYVAVAVDFHGSTGYGQKFTDAITGDWGGAPYIDLMKGLDYVLAHYSFIDRHHMGALGASYGGYMVNWIAGHTDRFQCIVSHDGSFDQTGMYYSTEELWFPEWEFRGTPWANRTLYEKWSPERFVDKWKTPMLVIHGAKDYRLVDTEGLSVFTALQRRGIPSKLLYFPDENHHVLKPKNSLLWHETVIGWLDRWCKPVQ